MHLDMQTSLIMLFEDFEVGSIKIGGEGGYLSD